MKKKRETAGFAGIGFRCLHFYAHADVEGNTRHRGKLPSNVLKAGKNIIYYIEYVNRCGGCLKNRIMLYLIMAVLLLSGGICLYESRMKSVVVTQNAGDYIKWVDFNASSEALKKACLLDVESYESEVHLDWITLLAYAAVRGGGEFDKKSVGYIEDIARQLSDKETTREALAEKYKYFSYYYEAYQAVLGGMLGEYELEDENGEFQKKYGLKAFSPIAKGFSYQDYDDFGVSRSFGYKRQHLGHDMMGLIGTPI